MNINTESIFLFEIHQKPGENTAFFFFMQNI